MLIALIILNSMKITLLLCLSKNTETWHKVWLNFVTSRRNVLLRKNRILTQTGLIILFYYWTIVSRRLRLDNDLLGFLYRFFGWFNDLSTHAERNNVREIFCIKTFYIYAKTECSIHAAAFDYLYEFFNVIICLKKHKFCYSWWLVCYHWLELTSL